MNDKKKKKEYVIPEAEIVCLSKEDIITSSGDPWNDGGVDNRESW